MSEPKPRKRALSDILEDGARLAFRHIVVLLRITAPLMLPTSAALIAVIAWLKSSSSSNHLAVGILVPVAAVYVLAIMISGSACMTAAAEASRGAKPSARAALKHVFERLGPFLCLATLLVVADAPAIAFPLLSSAKAIRSYAGLFFALALLSLWLMGRWSVALPAMSVEKIGIVGSLRRSAQLVRGSFMRALGTVVLGGILALFAGVLVAILVSVFSLGGKTVVLVVSLTSFSLGELFVAPFFAGFLVVLYRDFLEHEQGSSSDRASREGERSANS
jgi:hypothetical protein